MLFIAISFPFTKEIIDYLIEIVPIEIENMTVFSPTEFIRLKIYLSLILAILISHPLWYVGIYNFSTSEWQKESYLAALIILVLFRFFDILKPHPISIIDKKFKHS